MAVIYSDDFESYGTGSTPPFGSWAGATNGCLAGGVVAAVVATGSFGIGFGTGSRIVNLGALTYDGTAIYPSTTTSFRKFMNIGGNFNPPILRLISCAPSGTAANDLLLLGFSSNHKLFANVLGSYAGESTEVFNYNTWYELQVDAEFLVNTHVGTHSGCVTAKIDITSDEELILSTTFDTLLPVASLFALGVNRWIFQPATVNGSTIDDIVLEDIRDSIGAGGSGSPTARVTQAVVEYMKGHDLVLTQGTIFETVTEGTSTTQAQIAHAVIELLVQYSNGDWGVSEG